MQRPRSDQAAAADDQRDVRPLRPPLRDRSVAGGAGRRLLLALLRTTGGDRAAWRELAGRAAAARLPTLRSRFRGAEVAAPHVLLADLRRRTPTGRGGLRDRAGARWSLGVGAPGRHGAPSR